MKLVTFFYEGPIGTLTQEGGFAASDVILIDDRSEAVKNAPNFANPKGGDEGDWWDGKSLFEIFDEISEKFDMPKDDGDTIIPRVKLTIEVIGE